MNKGVAWIGAALVWLLASTTTQAGTRHYYYTDPQGTVLAKADAAGNIVEISDYRPYGARELGTSAGPGYTGHVNDADSGLVYMQARYYDPLSGRFLSIDPVASGAGNAFNFSRYAYAADNPNRYIDPDGRQIDRNQQERIDRSRPSCQRDPSCAFALDNAVSRWFAKAMRGIAAHKAIQADWKKEKPNMEVKSEYRTYNMLDKNFGVVDLMIRQDSSHPWSVFEIKPASYQESEILMGRAKDQLQRYVSSLRDDGQEAMVGRWSNFFPVGTFRQINLPTGLTVGGVPVPSSYLYTSPNDDGIILYYSGDPAIPGVSWH